MVYLLLRLMVAAFLAFCSSAAPARPQGEMYHQPDGTPVFLLLKGDPCYSWLTDYEDYNVIKDHHGHWVYAKKVDGELVSTDVAVGYGSPPPSLALFQISRQTQRSDPLTKFIGQMKKGGIVASYEEIHQRSSVAMRPLQ